MSQAAERLRDPAAVPTPTLARTDRAVPLHLVLGDSSHGVARYAGEVASACGAGVVRDLVTAAAHDGPVHLHLTDRLLGPTPDDAARAVERLAGAVALTVTLHDVPQPTDGPVFEARAAAYGRIVRAVRAWATSSHHEHDLVTRWCAPEARGAVVPLPVDRSPQAGLVPLDLEPVLGVFGFVYPGKGHREVVRAAARLCRDGTPARVRVIGRAADGHADEVADLCRIASALGVSIEVTGHLPDDEVAAALRSVAVPVVAHRNVSASGSLNSWLAAGRRPLVRDGAYAREMAALRAGTLTLFRDDTLAERVADALRRPETTWTRPGLDLAPHLPDVALAYQEWWRTT
ncbi:glycosyltransferase family 4 protein [Nocardioides rubriscoriae]|uniref:glycosyltransferase family 4 protein n=1 Tax=Nocardioides rubriscoriae TaxID=642762 RepID=UPI0011DEFFE4|nr:glycosyltransferase family 4 protein [Nocardioides rubriscoriae]